MGTIIIGFLILIIIVIVCVAAMIGHIDNKDYSTASALAVLMVALIISITLISYSLKHNYTNNGLLMQHNISVNIPHYNAYKALNTKD